METIHDNSYTLAFKAEEVVDFLHCLNPNRSFLEIRGLLGDCLKQKKYNPYHNNTHITKMYNMFVEHYKVSMGNPIISFYIPLLAILFHDHIYIPGAKDNEEASCEALQDFLVEVGLSSDNINMIMATVLPLIMFTKSHTVPNDAHDYIKMFLECDMAILGAEKEEYIQYAKDVRDEYSMYENEDYAKGRKAFLQEIKDYKFEFLTELNEKIKLNIQWELSELNVNEWNENCILKTLRTHDWIEPEPQKHFIRWENLAFSLLYDVRIQKSKPNNKKCIYAGSFMPITNGHLSIVKKSLTVFDEIYILIADNPKKKPEISKNHRKILTALECLNLPQVTIDMTTAYVAQYAEEHNINTMIRGLRPIGDFEGELQLCMANKAINPKLETFFIPCDIQDSYVSSSLVRELSKLGKGSEFVPNYVYTYLGASNGK